MLKQKIRKEELAKRHKRIRVKISGTSERPRLAVYRSNKHIYAQLIDDTKGITIVSAGSVEPEIKSANSHGGNIDASKKIGKFIAERALKKGVTQVVFDRGGYVYHGRIAALADAAREAGLDF
jgi:large subunit ribosomal protein L18